MNFKKTVKKIRKYMNKPYTKGDCVKEVAAATLATGLGFAGLAVWNAVENAKYRKEMDKRSERIERLSKEVDEILDEEDGA